jgi:glycosyltransferase involved in cell wall biosynthesis
MNTALDSDKPVVVLIGNYPIDRQESMLRFANLMLSQLQSAGFVTELISPRGYFGALVQKGPLAKWTAYVDKYILFPPGLALRLRRINGKYSGRKIVVHICDHSNAVYTGLARRWFPVLITCHDLLAVRAALGEDTGYVPSRFGKRLQMAIVQGLRKATFIACISRATQADVHRILGPDISAHSEVVPLALNYPYAAMSREQSMAVLTRAGIDLPFHGYVLHVGSGAPRKNREALLLAVAEIKNSWPGMIVFAGEPLSPEARALARSLGLEKRVREISRPDNETLHALYAAAHGFIFMSRFEGFGWPILEAQMSGCPIICSNRSSVPEIAGEGALIREPDDYPGIARDILRLQEPAFRESLIASGIQNALAYSHERMIGSYEGIYRRIR